MIEEPTETAATSDTPVFLSEKDWGRLIRDIHRGQVVPLVGPELITVPGEDGEPIPLRRYFTTRLAGSKRMIPRNTPKQAANEFWIMVDR